MWWQPGIFLWRLVVGETPLRFLSLIFRSANRWVRALWSIGPRGLKYHFEKQRKIRGCCACSSIALPGETFHHCIVCEDFETCDYCTPSAAHRHPIVPEVITLSVDPSTLRRARTLSEALQSAFTLYATRPCLGWRRRNLENEMLDGKYSWLTYAEVDRCCYALESKLRALLANPSSICSRNFVGLLGSMCKEWLIVDYSCTVGAYVMIPVFYYWYELQACIIFPNVLGGRFSHCSITSDNELSEPA